MTPYEIATCVFHIPFKLRKYQIDAINDLAPNPKSGIYMDTGTGKTVVSTCIALYKMLEQKVDMTLVVMPPILIDGWYRWLKKIPGVQVTVYRGTPKERLGITCQRHFTLMSMQILKKDFEAIQEQVKGKSIYIIVDEATSIKNVETGKPEQLAKPARAGKEATPYKPAILGNHDTIGVLQEGNHLSLLTGTPLSTPLDAYAYVKLIAPGVYRSLYHFKKIHVEDYDYFKTPTSWMNLDRMHENMKINSIRLLKTDVLDELPPVQYDPIYYELSKDHYRLYKELAEVQLIELKDGGKIDLTVVQKLFHAMGQVVVNYDYFADDPSKVSNSYEVVEEILEELGQEKLVLFANYRMTIRSLLKKLEKYGAVGAFGDISTSKQNANIQHFINSRKCRVLVAQPIAAGYGVDGLQHVCSDVLFLEMPNIPRDFHQAVARVWRDGQTKSKVHVRIAVAQRTLQMKQLERMLEKEELVSQVQRSYADLRKELFGEG